MSKAFILPFILVALLCAGVWTRFATNTNDAAIMDSLREMYPRNREELIEARINKAQKNIKDAEDLTASTKALSLLSDCSNAVQHLRDKQIPPTQVEATLAQKRESLAAMGLELAHGDEIVYHVDEARRITLWFVADRRMGTKRFESNEIP